MSDDKQFAGIVFDKGFPIDELMARVIAGLQARGIRLAGVRQTAGDDPEAGVGERFLSSLDGSWTLPIMQDRGTQASGCRLDYSAVMEASSRLVSSLEPDTQIVILNRFGRAEAKGNGFRSILEKCLTDGYTAICAVRSDYASEWEAFHGGLAEALPLNEDAVLDWCLSRQTVTAAAE